MSSIQCETRLEGDALKYTTLSQTVQGASIAQPADLQAVVMAGGSRVLCVCSLDLICLGKYRKAHIKSTMTLHSEGQL